MTVEVRQPVLSSRERVRATLEHREPDRIPIDFGGTPVSGIHASVVAALRDHYGLADRSVRVHEPYQMLGIVDDDLKAAMGVDVEGVNGRETMFGFRNDSWKPWTMPDGLEVLVSDDFNTTNVAAGVGILPGRVAAGARARQRAGRWDRRLAWQIQMGSDPRALRTALRTR